MNRKSLLSVPVLLSILASAALAQYDFEDPPINYNTAEVDNVISRLQEKIDSDDVKMRYDAKTGYLKAVLEALEVPVNSQGLVFSKTSFQLRRISPNTPRAVYFNDDVYVGFVVGGTVVEIAAADPKLGAVFYSLDQNPTRRPQFKRHTYECTQCHAGSMTQGVPGHTVRSVYPGADGRAQLQHGSFISTHESPFKQRWGGWYVTGTHGDDHHMGNSSIRSTETPESLDRERGSNVVSLEDYFATSRYLSKHSDIVSLMVMEHQTQTHNAITKANYQAIWTARDCDVLNEALERPENFQSESTIRRYESGAKNVVDHLLMVDEYRLKSPVTGTSAYTEEFAALGPFDSQGRTLRQLDLQTRLFKYPCSYLIYSEAFDALPDSATGPIYRQLWEILTGKNTDEDYAHLSPKDRQAILEILRETKDDLPKYWASKK
ncbi:MAG: hypothetical protein COA78_02095 [Blastopirellula sp.]|nr:MAG: hypothetical protein COA78_02095 [Blastopirellula sp.]